MLAPLPDPDNPGPEKQKIEVARTAVYRILENAESAGASFGLVTFTETVRVAVPLTEIRRENLPYIESLISMLAPSGRSAIWDAIAVGADLLRSTGGSVRGNLVLVTDGWDNASTRFRVQGGAPPPANSQATDLVPYLLPPESDLTFQVIGIGSGAERDKGVDSGRMNQFIQALTQRAQELHLPMSFGYQEVVTGSQLFAQMVNAFLDVDFEGSRPHGPAPSGGARAQCGQRRPGPEGAPAARHREPDLQPPAAPRRRRRRRTRRPPVSRSTC